MDFSPRIGVGPRRISIQKYEQGFPALRSSTQHVVTRGVARLKADLESGSWEERFGHLRRLETLDVCYRLLVTD